MTPVLTFLVHEPGVEPRRVTTEDEVVKIGRGARLHLALTNPEASRIHAVIEVSERGAVLIDLGSEPPTAINGARVNQQVLATGDRIQIGDSVIVVEAIAATRASANGAPRDGDGRALPVASAPIPNPLGTDSPPAGTWNWGDAPEPRRERSGTGPAVVIGLLLLGILGFLALR